MKKIFIGSVLLLAVVLSAVSLTPPIEKAEAQTYRTYPTFVSASSTAFTLTTTSQRLLATSTATKRLGATIQPINCTLTNNGGIFMRMQNDVVATANTGTFAFGSTTMIMGDYLNAVPVVQGSVQGITSSGTCTVLVTEWRAQY